MTSHKSAISGRTGTLTAILALILAVLTILSGAGISASAEALVVDTPDAFTEREIERAGDPLVSMLQSHGTSATLPLGPVLAAKIGQDETTCIQVFDEIYANALARHTYQGLPGAYIKNCLHLGVQYNYDTHVYTINPKTTGWYSSEADEQAAQREAERIVRSLRLTGSDQHKLEQLVDYSTSHYAYDNKKQPQSSCYAWVVRHHQSKMMCGGYSQMLYRLAKAAGIPKVGIEIGPAWEWGTNYKRHCWNTWTDPQGVPYVLDVTSAYGFRQFTDHKQLPSWSQYSYPYTDHMYTTRIPQYQNGTYSVLP